MLHSWNWIHFFLLLCMYPLLPVLYFTMANQTKPKKNVILNVTFSYASLTDPQIRQICDAFRKDLKRAMWILAVLPIPGLFLSHASLSFAVLINWTLPVIFWPHLIYVRHRRKLLARKKELNGGQGALHTETFVDLCASVDQPGPMALWYFLPPVILGFLPAADCLFHLFPSSEPQPGRELLFVYLLLAIMPPLCLLLHLGLHRQNPDVAGDDSLLNAALTRIRRQRNSRLCLFLSWSGALFPLLVWGMAAGFLSFSLGMILTFVLSLLILAAALFMEIQMRRAIECLAPASSTDLVNDEDSCWIGGLLYYNPNDLHLLKSDRTGLSSTVNLARPFGKVLAVFCLLCLLSVPLSSLWMIGEGFLPLTCHVENDSLLIRHLWQECRIPLSEIESVEILYELPSMWRTWGSNVGDLRKGHFRVDGYGDCLLYLQSAEGPFLVVRTEEDTYLLDWNEKLAGLFASNPQATLSGRQKQQIIYKNRKEHQQIEARRHKPLPHAFIIRKIIKPIQIKYRRRLYLR